MLENTQKLPNIIKNKEGMVGLDEMGKALGDAIKKHPELALVIAGVLGSFYILKDKKIEFHLKKSDLEIDFETE